MTVQTVTRLFEGLPVIVVEESIGAAPPAVHPAEAAEVARAVHARRVEHATGRACARRALERLGVRDFVLLADASRAPRWPSGVVGSITHSGGAPGGLCAVAVAWARDVVALGVDAEVGTEVARELWPDVLTPTEARWLAAHPEARRPRLARLAFSAKECFYKAQFPLTGKFLEFQEVEVAVDEPSATFEARVRGGAVDSRLAACRGRYLDRDDLVVTGIALVA